VFATYPSLADRVALVTGGASGIGAATVALLAEAGATVIVADIQPPPVGAPGRSMSHDVASEESWKRLLAEVLGHDGRLDILVNNAGLAPDNLAENVSEKDFDLTLAVNLKGTFFASQAAGRVMIQQKSGRIINMSSQAGFAALPTESVYCMTKAGIAHLTKCVAVEWAKHNITVNAVAPTFIYTPGTEEYLANEQTKKNVLSKIVLGKIGEPKDVANAVLFLVSPAASMITGTTLLVDGGWTAV